MSDTAQSVDLELATLEQIADELGKRYEAVIVSVHRPKSGTLAVNRGALTLCLGVYYELGRYLDELYDHKAFENATEDE